MSAELGLWLPIIAGGITLLIFCAFFFLFCIACRGSAPAGVPPKAPPPPPTHAKPPAPPAPPPARDVRGRWTPPTRFPAEVGLPVPHCFRMAPYYAPINRNRCWKCGSMRHHSSFCRWVIKAERALLL